MFEIERRFFYEKGIDWGIILDSKLPKVFIKNIEWMSDAKYLDSRPRLDYEDVELISNPLFELISEDAATTSISKICLRCDKKLGIDSGTSMYILQHMLANKRWVTDMNIPIKDSMPLSIANKDGELNNENLA